MYMFFIYLDGFSFFEIKVLSIFGFLLRYIIQKDITFRTKIVGFKNSRFSTSYKYLPIFQYNNIHDNWFVFSLRIGYLVKYKKIHFLHHSLYGFISEKTDFMLSKKDFSFRSRINSFLNLKDKSGKLKEAFLLKKIQIYKKKLFCFVKDEFFTMSSEKQLHHRKTTHMFYGYKHYRIPESVKFFVRYRTCVKRFNEIKGFFDFKFSIKNFSNNCFNYLNSCYRFKYINNLLDEIYLINKEKIEATKNIKHKNKCPRALIKLAVKDFSLYKNRKKKILLQLKYKKSEMRLNYNIVCDFYQFLRKSKHKEMHYILDSHFKSKNKHLKKKQSDYQESFLAARNVFIIKWSIQS
nr:hypothetical protein 1634Bnrm2_p059 [Cryptomonas sp.]